MRSFPSCWNKTLAQLGFKRKNRKNKKSIECYCRRSLFENLEARQILAADVIVDLCEGVQDCDINLRDAIAAASHGARIDLAFSGAEECYLDQLEHNDSFLWPVGSVLDPEASTDADYRKLREQESRDSLGHVVVSSQGVYDLVIDDPLMISGSVNDENTSISTYSKCRSIDWVEDNFGIHVDDQVTLSEHSSHVVSVACGISNTVFKECLHTGPLGDEGNGLSYGTVCVLVGMVGLSALRKRRMKESDEDRHLNRSSQYIQRMSHAEYEAAERDVEKAIARLDRKMAAEIDDDFDLKRAWSCLESQLASFGRQVDSNVDSNILAYSPHTPSFYDCIGECFLQLNVFRGGGVEESSCTYGDVHHESSSMCSGCVMDIPSQAIPVRECHQVNTSIGREYLMEQVFKPFSPLIAEAYCAAHEHESSFSDTEHNDENPQSKKYGAWQVADLPKCWSVNSTCGGLGYRESEDTLELFGIANNSSNDRVDVNTRQLFSWEEEIEDIPIIWYCSDRLSDLEYTVSVPTNITTDEDPIGLVNLSAVTQEKVDADLNNLTMALTTSSGKEVTVTGNGSMALSFVGTVGNLNSFLYLDTNITHVHRVQHAEGNIGDITKMVL